MEDQTPTFCKDFIQKRKESTNFSEVCENMSNQKPKGKLSCRNLNKYNNNNHKKEKSKFNKEHHRKRHYSQKFRLKGYKNIPSLDENNNNINNINNLIKKHKFSLRNDFDKKHVEIFLSSKEEAFKIPFLLNEENGQNNNGIEYEIK